MDRVTRPQARLFFGSSHRARPAVMVKATQRFAKTNNWGSFRFGTHAHPMTPDRRTIQRRTALLPYWRVPKTAWSVVQSLPSTFPEDRPKRTVPFGPHYSRAEPSYRTTSTAKHRTLWPMKMATVFEIRYAGIFFSLVHHALPYAKPSSHL